MRLFRALLHLYPASFRLEHGDEALATFAEQRRMARGPIAVVRLWTDTIADLVTLTQPLAKRGYSAEDIDGIFSGNFLRFLREHLQ